MIRDGAEQAIPTGNLVLGDLLAVGEGDILHADAAVRWAANLSVDESHLSGESEPQLKSAAITGADESVRRFHSNHRPWLRGSHGHGAANQVRPSGATGTGGAIRSKLHCSKKLAG